MDPPIIAAPGQGWVSVFSSRTRIPCEEQALVLGAMGLEYRVTEQPDGCHVLVPDAMATRAAEQLRLYHRENPGRAQLPWHRPPAARGAGAAVAWAVVLAAAYLLQAGYAFGVDWAAAGMLRAGNVMAGEWWRAVTALTLHADAEHLVGNMIFGGFFGYIAGQHLGSGVAMLAIAAGGAVGNLLNAGLQNAAHRSIGASTAVFAALGLVAATVWWVSRRHALSWARRWAPMVGGVALLAYIGTGDEQTDIVAHLMGFIAGAAGGALLQRLMQQGSPQFLVQAAAAVACAGLLAGSWVLALR